MSENIRGSALPSVGLNILEPEAPAFLPGAFQVLSRAVGRAIAHGPPLRGTESGACGIASAELWRWSSAWAQAQKPSARPRWLGQPRHRKTQSRPFLSTIGSPVLVSFRPKVGTMYAAKCLAQVQTASLPRPLRRTSAEQQPRAVEPAKDTSPTWETERRVLTPFYARERNEDRYGW